MKTYSIARYGTRNWAVYETAEASAESELLCVTVYKKGAQKVVEKLEASQEAIINSQSGKDVA